MKGERARDAGKHTIGLPEHVEKGRSGNKNDLYAHALEIVETRYETFEIPAIAKLSLAVVVLKLGTEIVIIGGIAVCKFVHEDSINGQSAPVVGRGGPFIRRTVRFVL
jgi:hypothetical protein